jgi:hypothetical protein
MGFLRDLGKLLTRGSRAPGESVAAGDRDVDNVDAEALATTQSHLKGAPSSSAGPAYPPGYVKAYDEGRPRK